MTDIQKSDQKQQEFVGFGIAMRTLYFENIKLQISDSVVRA